MATLEAKAIRAIQFSAISEPHRHSKIRTFLTVFEPQRPQARSSSEAIIFIAERASLLTAGEPPLLMLDFFSFYANLQT